MHTHAHTCTNQAAELGLTTQPFLTLLICLIIGYGVGDTFMSVVEAAVTFLKSTLYMDFYAVHAVGH